MIDLHNLYLDGLSGVLFSIAAREENWPINTGKPYKPESSDLGVMISDESDEWVRYTTNGSMHHILTYASIVLSLEETKQLIQDLQKAVDEEEKYNKELNEYMEKGKSNVL